MIPLTDMRLLYRSLKNLPQEAQLRRAEKMISAPDYLRTLFERSIDQFEPYSNVSQPFHPPRVPVRPRRDGGALFCQALMSGYAFTGVARTLDFDFVDHEIVPSRTEPETIFSDGSPATTELRVDALLVNRSDRLPIVAEIKRHRDKTPFIALVQTLAEAAELVTRKQRDRLVAQYPSVAFRVPIDRLIDIYLIFVNPPRTGRFLHELRRCTERLATDISESRSLRRIALINAIAEPDLVELRPDGIFEDGRPQ
jgi:hypothetical protein